MIVIIIVLITIGLNFDKLSNKVSTYVADYRDNKLKSTRKITKLPPINNYAKKRDYNFVQYTNNYEPQNYIQLKNIFYSILDNGWEEFTFYCDENYTNCINDIKELSKDKELLSAINNYVHPYNSYKQVRATFDDTGEITFKITHQYNENEINYIQTKIELLEKELINNNMTTNEKITKIHDYIINNTKYDIDKVEKDSNTYDSARAYGLLFQGYAICSGYTDVMAIFLYDLGIDNFKVSSDSHVWNAIKIDNEFKHLDLTWDDPVTSSGRDTLSHDYFLINTSQLKELDTETKDHDFNNNYYIYFN